MANMRGDEQAGGAVVTFHSSRPGIGRTMALTNVAVLLAGQNLRVLVVDADSGAADYWRYLSRGSAPRPRLFTLDGLYELWRNDPDASRLSAALAADVTSLQLAQEISLDYLRLDTRPPALDAPPGAREPAFAEWLRAGIRGADYDYVLLDSPLGLEGGSLALIAGVSDVVVTCHTLSRSGVEEGVATLERVRGATPRTLRAVPLAMRVDAAVGEALTQAREVSRAGFAGRADASAGHLEIPYVADYSLSESLAVLTEPPGREGSLRQACERLAEVLTDGRFSALAGVTLLYRPPYREWAEWIEDRIGRSGVSITRQLLDPSGHVARRPNHAVLIVSPTALEPAAAERLKALMTPSSDAVGTRASDVWAVRVDDEPFPPGLPGPPPVDLRGLPEERATAELRRRLRLTGPAPALPLADGAPRFPRRRAVTNVLGRNLNFVGRDDLIERMRDHLTAESGRHCLLTGSAGHGKSQVALEFAHRFGGAYDLVWWVPGSAPAEALAALAAKLGVPTGGDAVRAVLAHLASGEVGKWLLVYDNADGRNLPERLMPDGPAGHAGGHVIVTSRLATNCPPWFQVFEVDRFTAQDGVELIRKWVPTVPHERAAEVVGLTARLPIAVHLAAAWLRHEAASQGGPIEEGAAVAAVQNFLGAFDDEVSRRPDDDSPHELAHRVTVAMAMDALRTGVGREAAVWLIEACAFLSPDGVDLRFLRSPQLRDALARVDTRLDDPIMMDAVLRSVDRMRLARIDLGRVEPLRTHRLVQELIRDSMPEEVRARRNAEILEALASYATDEVGPVYGELAAHVVPASAADSASPRVRRWVVNQVRFHWTRMDHASLRTAHHLGELALACWEADGSAQGLPELRAELSSACRLLGKHQEAVDLADSALRDQGLSLGVDHPRTLVTAMAYAVALRARGDFDEAYIWDETALKGIRELFGADHTLTGQAMNNLAISHNLMGKPREAIRLAEERVRRRITIFGEYDQDALWTKCNLAVYLRDAGQYERAWRALLDIQSYLSFVEKEPSQIRRPLALRVESGLAITERRLGRSFDALHRDRDILDDFRQLHGDNFLGTLMCRLSLAADLHAERRPGEAVKEAGAVLTAFTDMYGLHPFTFASQTNLSIYLRASGELDQALAQGREAFDRLREKLGPRHPYTLAAAANHASTLVKLGQEEEAAELEVETGRLMRDVLGARHPNTKIVADNLRATMAPYTETALVRRDIDIEVAGF